MTKIYWDKGHGGSDPGACGNGLQEKNLTHKIVEYAMAYINANYDNVQQRTSRAGDETKSLSQRTNDANAWGADILMSIHINSASAAANGFESFTYTSPSQASIAFQNVLHPEIFAVMKAWGISTDRGKKRANFHMVRESRMPAVLTENLFISNTADSNRLKDEAFLKAIGEAHARGVSKFLGLPEKTAPQPAPAPQVQEQPKPQPKPTPSSIVPYPGIVFYYEEGRPYMRGKDVERIQRAVGVKADGIFGKDTRAAVKAYQKRQGLEVDGKVGPITWARMF